ELAGFRAGVLEACLTEALRQDHDEEGAEGDPRRRILVAQDERREPDAQEATEKHADGGEGAGDEALSVAREGIGQDQQNEEDVEDVHRSSSFKVVFGAGTGPRRSPSSMRAGSSTTRRVSHGSAQPMCSK